ncbi:MAG: Cna B-type domain-containing protein, partial [Erysipelotrichaceae bacterium]|nr:Cna B-type domain-containing protein [Erysipelotrichaceae bacterium]
EVPGFTYTLDMWTYTWNNLPKYKDGKEIEYTVGEKELKDYDTRVDGLTIENYRFVQHYYEGEIKITKIYKESHKEKKTNKVFFVQVFEDEAMTVPYTEIMPIPMVGEARQTITVPVALGDLGVDKTYYVAEVTEDGAFVKSNGKMTVTIDNPSPTATIEIVPETVITNDYDTTNTADTTTNTGWMVTMCVSLAGLFVLMFARKKTRVTE